jgi:gamma-glutamylcyclotransferase
VSKTQLYFAYGSNMSPRRLRSRTPSAEMVGLFTLQGHKLKFHKVGKDGSGKCNAWNSGSREDIVEGVVFKLDENQVADLDKAEGLGYGYEKRWVEVESDDGMRVRVFAYFATRVDDDLSPFSWYLEHVLRGASHAGLTERYIAAIGKVSAIADPDKARERAELDIYR